MDGAVAALVDGDGVFAAGAQHGELPAGLAHLAVDGLAALTGGGTAVLLPAWADYPQVPGAFVHLGDVPPADVYDCYDSRCHRRWLLGDGWYWYERDPVSWAAPR